MNLYAIVYAELPQFIMNGFIKLFISIIIVQFK